MSFLANPVVLGIGNRDIDRAMLTPKALGEDPFSPHANRWYWWRFLLFFGLQLRHSHLGLSVLVIFSLGVNASVSTFLSFYKDTILIPYDLILSWAHLQRLYL